MADHVLSRYRSIVDHADDLWDASQRPLPTCIWTNRLKTQTNALNHILHTNDIVLEPVPWCYGAFRSKTWAKPGDTIPYRAGWYLIQEEIAMTAVCALDPQPGEVVLDLCAAPGNKTLQIASRLADSGFIIANEWNAGRLSSLWSAIARMGTLNIATTNYDGRTIPLPHRRFDRVLADVPCSGEGTLRKNPHRDWSVARTMKAIARLVPIQKQLLNRALDMVKPGGVVVYSTCTFAPEENEAILDAVMGDRAVVEPFQIPGLRHLPGLTHWDGAVFRSDLVHAHRYFPHLNDTGGFFVARLRRTHQSTHQGLHHAPTNRTTAQACPATSAYVEAKEELAAFCDRFGLDLEGVQPMRLWKKGQAKLWLAAKGCDPLSHPLECVGGQTLGLPLYRVVRGALKPTTAALQRLGTDITRNVVELETPAQMHLFLEGKSQPLPSSSAHTLEEGYVHVRAKPYELGCGLWSRGRLYSQLPKALRIRS